MSWHLRYYEYSYMYYILGSAALCLAYTVIYCVKMPVNKIKNLKDVIDFDPQINEGLYEIIRAGEQERHHSIDSILILACNLTRN